MELYKAGGDGLSHADGEDQLGLGIRIITSAYQNKMHGLEQEIRGLRMTFEEQRGNVAGLQKKNSALEVELVEGHQRAQQLSEENKELFKTMTNLRKQIGRLEHLKQAVLTSIQDDAEKETEFGDMRMLMSEEYLRGATPLTTAELGFGGPQRHSVPRQHQGLYEQQQHHHHHAVSGPPLPQEPPQEPVASGVGGAAGTVDGKQFFRQARSRLSYEAFNMFLASIKRLNNGQQTREETLEEARGIFGPELADLYKDFENLLHRHGM